MKGEAMKKSTEYRTRDSNGIKTPNTGFLSIGDYMQFWPGSIRDKRLTTYRNGL